MEVARFLKNWLTHHIHEVDFQYVKFLQEKDVFLRSL
jgi:hemerythrin